MKPYSLERTQTLPIGLDEAWSFFSDPGNLARITPPAMDFRLTSPPQDETYAGMVLTYTVRPLFGIKFDWTSEITQLNRPYLFVDEQRFGPYRFWHHQHHFKKVDDGVEMRDIVHYLLPHMQFTGLINTFIVAPRLKRIFDYRCNALQTLFPTQTNQEIS